MSFPFSPRTIGVLVRAIESGYSDAGIGTLFLEAEVDDWAPARYANKETRLQTLFARLREDSSDDARRDALELVRLVLQKGAPRNHWAEGARWFEEVRAAAAADGWEFDSEAQTLVPAMTGVDAVELSDSVQSPQGSDGC